MKERGATLEEDFALANRSAQYAVVGEGSEKEVFDKLEKKGIPRDAFEGVTLVRSLWIVRCIKEGKLLPSSSFVLEPPHPPSRPGPSADFEESGLSALTYASLPTDTPLHLPPTASEGQRDTRDDAVEETLWKLKHNWMNFYSKGER